MIGIVIPAHNEAALIARCLSSVFAAARDAELHDEAVMVTVVLDACSDDTGSIALRSGARVSAVSGRNVGIARAAGAKACLDAGVRWLAFTDADSEVAEDWLVQQLRCGADAVCGTVGVRDWGDYGSAMCQHYANTYTDADGHGHIHGANMGVSARAYRIAGGFPPLASSEDVALVQALQATGANIAWSARAKVWTSARKDFRAQGGFGATLMRVDDDARATAAKNVVVTGARLAGGAFPDPEKNHDRSLPHRLVNQPSRHSTTAA